MEFEDVLTLVKAGYTKEEISAMIAGNTIGAAGTEQKPAGTEQKPEGTEQKPEGTEQKPETMGADLAGVLSKINDTLAALQAAAIAGDSRGAATKPTAGQSLAKAITMTK